MQVGRKMGSSGVSRSQSGVQGTVPGVSWNIMKWLVFTPCNKVIRCHPALTKVLRED